LSPKVIRQRLGIPPGDRNVGAHERRGHFRNLYNKRYKRNDNGTIKKIWVRNTWVGPSEGRYGNRNYKVILE